MIKTGKKLNTQLEATGAEYLVLGELLRKRIQSKQKFTVKELSEELTIDPNQIHVFLNNPANNILDHFDIIKTPSKKGGMINQYIKK